MSALMLEASAVPPLPPRREARYTSLAAVGLLFFALVTPSGAQSPDVLASVTPARLAAMGMTGVAGLDVSGRAVNPALLVAAERLSGDVGLARTPNTDLSTLSAGVAFRLGEVASVALDARQRRVEHLVDDPDLQRDPGLTVQDMAARLTAARRFAHGRLAVGAAAEYASSRVFATTGSGWNADVGATFRVVRRLTVAATASRVGRQYRWRSMDGAEWQSALGRTLAVGTSVVVLDARALRVVANADEYLPLEPSGSRGLRVGGEMLLRRLIALRAGYSPAVGIRDAPGTSAGFGLAARRLKVDVARDHLGSALGERTLIGLTIVIPDRTEPRR